MDWRWCACLLLAACFSEPPADSTGSTGDASSSSSGAPGSTSVAQTSSSTSEAGSSEGGSSSTSTTSGFETSTGDVEACLGEGMCIPSPPPPWNGPVVARIAEDDEPNPLCPPGTTELWEAGRDPAAACRCDECSGEGVSCDIVLGWGANGSCEGNTEWATECQPFAGGVEGQFWLSLDIGLAAGAACTPPEPSEPRFRTRAIVCDPRGEPCDGGTCVSGPVCVWRDGEHECPAMYTLQTVVHGEVVIDEASCASCSCGQNSTQCEEATISLYDDASCGNDPIAVPDVYDTSSCAAYEDKSTVLIEEIGSIDIQPEIDCSSNLNTITASATFTETMPRTLCCVP